MNSAELKSALKTLHKEISTVNLHSAWENFFSTAINSWRGRNRGNVSEHFSALKSALLAIRLQEYPIAQQRALETVEADRYVGARMVAEIEDILSVESFDPEGASQKLEQLKQKYDRFRSLIDQLQQVLTDAGVKPAGESGAASLQVVFRREASIESMADLADCVEAWNLIFRSFAALFELRTEDMKVVSLHKASPLVLEVTAPIGYIGAFGFACTLVLAGLEKYLKLRKAAAEIRSIELGNKKLEQELEASSKALREGLSCEAAEQVAKQHRKGKDGEVVNGLAISIEKLYVFIERGGDVSARIPKSNDKATDEERSAADAVAQTFAEIRRIENTIEQRLLGEGAQEKSPKS